MQNTNSGYNTFSITHLSWMMMVITRIYSAHVWVCVCAVFRLVDLLNSRGWPEARKKTFPVPFGAPSTRGSHTSIMRTG